MRHPALPLLSALLALACLPAAPAFAAANASAKIFVASYGSDSNVGNTTAPMRTLQAAHDAVGAGGEIIVLDTAGYGALAISKSITVTAPTGVTGLITAPANSAGILVSAASSDRVTLHGLTIGGTSTANGYGIYANSVGNLRVEDCTVHDVSFGIGLYPSATSHFAVRGCTIRDVSEGVYLGVTNSTAVVDVVVTDCAVDNASDSGLIVSPAQDFGHSQMTAINCVVTHCKNGLTAYKSSYMYVDTCTVSGSTAFGVNGYGGFVISFGHNRLTNNNMGNFSATQDEK